MTAKDVLPAQPVRQSLIAKFASRYSVEPDKMLVTLKATCFKGEVSNEQMMALLVVADQYDLNPWTKEIYAFPDKGGGIVPVVGVDGWISILNRQSTLQAVEFAYSDEITSDGIPEWIECRITRSDRTAPITAREYFAECRRDTGPWKSHPRRFLRHKALVQAARIAYGFSGIYDEDEASRIIEGQATVKPRTEMPVALTTTYGGGGAGASDMEQQPAQGNAGQAQPRSESSGESQTPLKLARPNQLALLRRLTPQHGLDEDRVCLHFDVQKLEDLEFDTVDVALAFIKSQKP